MKTSGRSLTEWTAWRRAAGCVLVGWGVAVCGLAGCKPAAEPRAAEAEPPKRSATDELIEGVTGKTAVDAGLRAKKQIGAINEASAKRFEDF